MIATKLRIYLRQKQLYKDQDIAQPVVVQKNDDGSVEYVAGTVDQEWIEHTKDTQGLDEMRFSWSATNTDSGDSDTVEGNEVGSNYDKGLSSNLVFRGAAFQFIFDTLLTQSYQTLNSIEVKLLDTMCEKNYRVFEIKRDNVEYAPYDEPCMVKMVLREADPVWHAFQKSSIEDNWQNWFNANPSDNPSDKEFPQVAFVVEKKPKFLLVAEVALIYLVGMLSVGGITTISAGREWIRKILGAIYFCPSPLIRDYLLNICQKYGYTMDTIFDDLPANRYRNTAMFFPCEDSYRNFDGYDSPSRAFLWNNRTAYPVVKYLNMLKKVFCAEWYVTPDKKLVFKHKDYFMNQPPLYDFTQPGAIPIYKLRYTFNGRKKAAYGNYAFPADPQDTCSAEIQDRYKTIVDFDGVAENPMLEGNITKQFEFGATAFYRDGTAEPYMTAAIRIGKLVAAGAIVIGMIELFVSSNLLFGLITGALLGAGFLAIDTHMTQFINNDTIDGCVRVSSKEINLPRLLDLTPGYSMDRAKVWAVTFPAANPRYNDGEFENFYMAHLSNDGERCEVDGAEPWSWVGCNAGKIYNYGFNIDEKFVANLYTNALEIENPIYAPEINQDFEMELDLCCEVQDLLGVWENDFAKIGHTVILEQRGDWTIKGRINFFELNESTGRVTMKGTILEGQILRPGSASGAGGDDCNNSGTCMNYAVQVTEVIERNAQVDFVDCCGNEKTIMIREINDVFPGFTAICAQEGSIVVDAPASVEVIEGSAGCTYSNLQIKNTTPCYKILSTKYLGFAPEYGFEEDTEVVNPVTIRRTHGILEGGNIAVEIEQITESCTAYLCFRVNGHFVESLEVTGSDIYNFSPYYVHDGYLVEVFLTDEACVED